MLSEMSLKIQALPRIVFGVGAAAKLASHIKACGKREALIVTDKGLVSAGLIQPLADLLSGDGLRVEVFDGVEPNPTDRNVDAGAEALRGMNDAAVVPIGGGSSMDAAKAIGLMGPNGGRARDYGFGCKPDKPGQPLVAVPTTAGTGSETNMFSLITDAELGRKIFVGHPSVQPVVAVLDPKLTEGLPPYPTATCGIDVLTHAIEAFTSRGANPYTDSVALRALRMAWEHLPRAHADGSDIEARSQMLLASAMAAIAFNVTGLGVCHATGHPVSARFNAAHGQTLATMMPHVMEYNLDVCEAKYAEVADAMGLDVSGQPDAGKARAAIDAFVELRGKIDTDRSLKDLGASADDIGTLVEDALADMTIRSNPKKAPAESVASMYEAALG